MAVSVSRILTLPAFKNAKVLTGQEHLGNVVKQVSISDSPLSEADYALARNGDFYLSEFYFAGKSVSSMITYLAPMVMSGSSGICIIDEYVKELPQEVLDYCDSHKLPIVMNSVDVSYGQMIREIMELIIADGQNALLESELSAIISDTLDEDGKLRVLRTINPHLQNSFAVFCVYCGGNEKAEASVRELFSRDILCSGVSYKNGVLGLVSCSDTADLKSKTQYYIDKLKDCDDDLAVGVSDSMSKLRSITKALNQAISAADAALKSAPEKKIIRYSELGIMKLLLLLSDNAELEEFYEDIILTIRSYDEETGSQLFDTMCAFRNCGYQYRETAQALFIHENTVRYRIAKVKELIEAKAPGDDFREAFSIALKCADVLNISENISLV